MFVIGVAFAGALPHSAMAVELITSVQSGSSYTFTHLLAKYRALKDQVSSARRQFETSAAYDTRIESAVETFNAFLQETFRFSTRPSEVRLDWENSTILITKEFPLPVARARHSGVALPKLELVIRTSPDLARVVSTLPEQLVISLLFQVSRTDSLIIRKLKVMYGDREIYREG